MTAVKGQQRHAVQIGLTLPPDIYRAFVAEAGDGYGAKVQLFLRMWNAYLDTKRGVSLRAQLNEEYVARRRAERLLKAIEHLLRTG